MRNDALQKNSFDELVAGISAEERRHLLDKIQTGGTDLSSQTFESPEKVAAAAGSGKTRIQSESIFYRFFLWLRSFFTGRKQEAIYNRDRIVALAHKVSREHPGLIDFSRGILNSLFYEKVKGLENCAAFFRPYLVSMSENEGAFYVFLSTFVAPEISENITSEADPYTIPFDRALTNELRLSLVRKLDAAIKDAPGAAKKSLYNSVRGVEWIRQFASLPYLRFTAQFKAGPQNSHSCSFADAQTDYPAFARVLTSGQPIANEALEALFLFAQKRKGDDHLLDADSENALDNFLKQSLSAFSSIQNFISTVPLVATGRIIFDDCGWQPESFGGAEDWSIKFRGQWKRIFDERWNEWLRDRKKTQLADGLRKNFQLAEFPELPYRPWAAIWGGLPFRGETTAGFLAWFNKYRYPDVIATLNIILLEGVFIKSGNRAEFSEAVNSLSSTSQKIEAFVASLSPNGDIGTAFNSVAAERVRTIKEQDRIDALIRNAEAQAHELDVEFCTACRTIENVFHGIFDEPKDSDYDSLQNLTTMRGAENRDFRNRMLDVRSLLKNAWQLLADIEPLEMPRKSSGSAN